MNNASCIFCRIVSGEIEAAKVFEDEHTVVFLDSDPLFPGHCLVCPRVHYETLPDVPAELLTPLFSTVKLICGSVERGVGAEGSFVAQNNIISQSVPHVHVHVVPRRKGDGLKGFFWPRRPYRDREHMLEIQQALQSAITYVRSNG
ncbi:MAG: HIT domain-containing protein [Bryobacteraceae bacterium]|nr:HIT domain-containing protein [Bryobacteraceae bacterium]